MECFDDITEKRGKIEDRKKDPPLPGPALMS